MERFPVELLYVLGFIVFIVYNMVMQRAARRRQQQEQAGAAAPPEPAPEPAEEEPLEEMWGRTAVPVPVPAAVPVREPAPRPLPVYVEPAPRRVHPVRALLRTERDLQRAMIVMTVLGPCRAQEPPER